MSRTLHLGLYSVDPPALDTFQSCDPESFAGLSAIADALTYMDLEGRIQPGLAVGWTQHSPTEIDFELRRGVRFHDGQPYDADDVVATFQAHLDPATCSVTARALLSNLVDCVRLGSHSVRMVTRTPDRFFLHHLHVSGAIYPKGVLAAGGPAAVHQHPVGTGPFKLLRWDRGREIVLGGFAGHFRGPPKVDDLRIPILPQKRWVHEMIEGRLDVAFNLDAVGAEQAARAGLLVATRQAALSQWMLLSNRGPLGDRRVRQALQLAVHKHILSTVAESGRGAPKAAVATPEQIGHCPALRPYPYDPAAAVRLLEEAGCGKGLVLRGLCSDGSVPFYLFAKEFLARVGVTLEAEVLPRSRWIQRVCNDRVRTGAGYDGDFAIFHCDNPTVHALFDQYTLLGSEGHFSLHSDPVYDDLVAAAITAPDEAVGLERLHAIERHVHEEALLLTSQLHVYAAMRRGFTAEVSRNGHFDTAAFLALGAPERPPPRARRSAGAPDLEAGDHAMHDLVEASSHLGVFYLDRPVPAGAPQALWENLLLSQDRWHLQMLPMVREIVDQLDAKISLRNILSSTTQVGIVGLSQQGRALFVNKGLDALLGGVKAEDITAALCELSGEPCWERLVGQVQEAGAFAGPVLVRCPGAAPRGLFLNLTPALNETGTPYGYTLVFSDFSGERERIRHQAVRDILDNVTFGFFVLGPDLVVQEQHTGSCLSLFQVEQVAGRRFLDLVPGLDAAAALTFALQMEQVFADIMPPELTLAQTQQRFAVGARALHIEGRAIRDEAGAIKGVLFTVSDVTSLEESQREARHHRLLIDLLRNREAFREFVNETVSNLEQAGRALLAGDEPACRRTLHTIKGNAGAHGLSALMAVAHEVESRRPIQPADVAQVRTVLLGFLTENRDVLRLEQEGMTGTTHAVSTAQLHELLALVGEETAQGAPMRRWLAQAMARPARVLLGPVEQMVSRLAKRQGKRVRMLLRGADTPVDAQQLGPVLQVLSHLLRNAVDHGLEPPEERGTKPTEGTLRLDIGADPEGYTIIIADDGRGIDGDRLVARAQALGVISEREAAGLSEADRVELIFHEGLSTAAEVTDISGRGVGMAAVRTTVTERGGQLSVETVPQMGTRFLIRVPRGAREAVLQPRR